MRKWIEIEREKYEKSLEREEITDDENGYNAYIRVAVTSAVEECIREDILRDFFLKHKEEAIDMSIEEYSFEKQFKVIREDGYESGYTNGYDAAKAEDEATIAEKDAEIARQESEIAKLKSIIAQHNQ